MKELAPYLWVGLGGFLGANARYIVSRWSAALFGVHFPWGTFLVNISGSFLLGFFATLLSERLVPQSDTIRLAVAIGFIGSYTTFSTFEFETHALLDNGQWLAALLNILGSVAAGFAAVRLGLLAGRA